MPTRVAVIGDIGGHLDELRGELIRLGADASTLRLPDDLAVVQVGDLIHRGPDSPGVVALIDHYLATQPDQWVQLAGNHEAQYLREPAFTWPETIPDETAATLRAWWADGRMRVAAVVRGDDETWLITHAGLTEGFWRQALDAPAGALDAARAINSFIGVHEDVLFHAGERLGGGRPNLTAGPVWASTAGELVPSWLRVDGGLPFSQVHGHSMVVDWARHTLRCTDDVAAVMTIDEDAKHETATLPGGRIVGVDPGHARKPRRPWHAFMIAGSVVT